MLLMDVDLDDHPSPPPLSSPPHDRHHSHYHRRHHSHRRNHSHRRHHSHHHHHNSNNNNSFSGSRTRRRTTYRATKDVQADPNPEVRSCLRDHSVHPIQPADPRTIVWELKRPRLGGPDANLDSYSQERRDRIARLTEQQRHELQSIIEYRNWIVVEVDGLTTVVVGCNTAAYFLGSVEAAKAAAHYCTSQST
jgi:G3E family GTPase